MPNYEDQHNEKTAREIFGERAEFYVDSKAHTDPENLSRLTALASPQKNWKALDLATGTGHTAFALAPLVNFVIGLDLTPEMLEKARELGMQKNLTNVTFELGDAEKIPYPNESFNLVTCRRAAHHFLNIQKSIKEMKRVLKPNGVLIVDDRSVPESKDADELLNTLDKLHDASHIRQYSAKEWKAFLETEGFEIKALEPYQRLRPLSHMKSGVSPRDCLAIDECIAKAPEKTLRTIGFEIRESEIWHLHFYLLISALRKA